MDAALVPADGVDLVDDDITNGGKDHSRLLRRQHQIQRFGRRDQNVGRMLEDRRPFGLCRISGTNSAAEFRETDRLRSSFVVNSL